MKKKGIACFGHVKHSCDTVRTACDIQVDGWRGIREAQADMEEADGEGLL